MYRVCTVFASRPRSGLMIEFVSLVLFSSSRHLFPLLPSVGSMISLAPQYVSSSHPLSLNYLWSLYSPLHVVRRVFALPSSAAVPPVHFHVLRWPLYFDCLSSMKNAKRLWYCERISPPMHRALQLAINKISKCWFISILSLFFLQSLIFLCYLGTIL